MRTLLRFLLVLAFVFLFVAWLPFLFVSVAFDVIDDGLRKLLDVIEEKEEEIA